MSAFSSKYFVLHLLIQQNKMLVETLEYCRNCSKFNKSVVLQRQNHGLILIHCIKNEIKYDNIIPDLFLLFVSYFSLHGQNVWSGIWSLYMCSFFLFFVSFQKSQLP